ncbi:inositol 1,4,5-triphosphate receptor associated 2 isoform X3 [Anolis carolinensis]|uniref:inositol 1,4,5-triphosphate receptor associated 2 isoform X3 n=1 Tax=Anolis carolinensis TaxID=28377 RepID=UPI002F2B235B
MGKMSSENHSKKRHHHPVDSLCRKLQAINMMDQTSNPALQIPKFQSKNFDSPQSNAKKNLEEILKKRTLKSSDSDNSVTGNNTYLISPSTDNDILPTFSPVVTPAHKRVSDIRSETLPNSNKEKARKSWLLIGEMGSCSPYSFRQEGSASAQLCGMSSTEQKCTYLTSSPDLSNQEPKSNPLVFQSPVSKRASLGKGKRWKLPSEARHDEDADVSLICEEDLLTTMFSACDVERRVDFLRCTTSRSSEDSGLEELCNMLDPDQKDISMDLETYHAIMREWIEDCRRNGDETVMVETTTEGIPGAKRTPMRMNVTSGSLEAFGGDVSRGDLETSDLITCIADLQFNNQKLQEENGQLKQSLDAMEEANNRLMEEIEELRNQIKSFQQSISRIKVLKEELEEAKNNLNASEEKRLKMASHSKLLEKDNQALILKISSLQEENIRNALDSDGLERKIVELSRNLAELQMQVQLYESMLGSKDASLLKKELDIQEMKSTLKEYSSVIETLRVEKNKLVNNVQQMQQELISNGINFPLIYKFNSSIVESPNSLHCELELAQGQSEVPGTERTVLDESLDKEVLLLLQGPEQVGEKFKATIQNLQEELAGLRLLWAGDSEENVQDSYEKKLEEMQKNLENKEPIWIQKLELLNTQKESIDKELIKMAGNLRRMRTEQLHLKRALSSREQELESVRQLKEDIVLEAGVLKLALQEATKQVEDASKKVKDLENNFLRAQEEASSLQKRLEESLAEQRDLQNANTKLAHAFQQLEQKTEDQSTALDSLRKKYFKALSCGVLCQVCGDGDGSPQSGSKVDEKTRPEEKVSCCCQRSGNQESQLCGSSRSASLRCCCSHYTSLLDALALESLDLIQRSSVLGSFGNPGTQPILEKKPLRNEPIMDMMPEVQKCNNNYCVGEQTDVDFASDARMDTDLTKESDAKPLTEHASSEPSPSVEALLPASECTNGSQDVDSTPLPTMEGEVSKPAVVGANIEAKQETPRRLSGGSASPGHLPSLPVSRNRQKTNNSPNEKEVEAEFLRLSLGFKCDLFTLEKRVRLEERSRDLAEGNLRKEIAGALKLLDSLASLSEDNQVQETVKKLQKSLELLNQHATRIASKAEMLGAIHQESRLSKAVEVMIQHLENLKRTYAREHAELEELKGLLLQNEKSFGSLGDRDESSIRKLSGSLKPSSLRRVSIATLPGNTGKAITLFSLGQLNEADGSERNDKFNRRSSWGLVGAKQGEKRPSLQRYVSSHSWTESEEEQLEPENTSLEPEVLELQGSKARKLSEKENKPPKWRLQSLCARFLSCASSLKTSFSRASKALCMSVIAAMFIAIVSFFIMGFPFQRPVQGAPVEIGDAWTSVQQLLWPYTGLQHQGPPPV